MRTRAPMMLAVLVACLAAVPAQARKSGQSSSSGHSHHKSGPPEKGTTGTFDYYVMALSWSPTFCQTHPDEKEQCSHKGFGFVLHGLWPQYERGGGPEQCTTDKEPDRKTVANALAFMPSHGLITHEWRAHGACTGLDPAGYFGLADRAFAVVHVPPELTAPAQPVQLGADALRAAFKRANPKLGDDMLTMHCSRGELAEVRFCLDKDLGLRACGKRMQSRCPATATFTLPASR